MHQVQPYDPHGKPTVPTLKRNSQVKKFTFTIEEWLLFYLINVCMLQYRGNYRMRIYERENFGGQMMELMDDCDSIMDRHRMSDCQSCNVMDGHWLMYEQPHFRGRMMYMRPGEYKSFREMGMNNMKFMSMRRIMDSM